jgi:hypothetical protein
MDLETPNRASRPDEIDGALARARKAIAAGELKTALRWADRARRCVAESPDIDALLDNILLQLGETEPRQTQAPGGSHDEAAYETQGGEAQPDESPSQPERADQASSSAIPEVRAGLIGLLRNLTTAAWAPWGGAPLGLRRAPAAPPVDEAPQTAEGPETPDLRALQEARLLSAEDRFVLLLSHDRSGGVDRFVQQRCQEIRAEGGAPLILRADREVGDLHLTVADASLDGRLTYDPAVDADRLLALLKQLDPKHLELHHFLDHDAALIDRLINLDLKLTVYIHDYSWICPRLTLITGTGKYCGEPAVTQCEACIAAYGSSLAPTLSAASLRERSARWLERAERIVAPAQDVATRLAHYFPKASIAVEPWEEEVYEAPTPAAAMPRTLKVAVIGAIGPSKGYDVLLNCVRDAKARALPLEFVVVGFTQDDAALMAAGDAFVTGRYEEREVDALIRREEPDVALFVSVWPETWCFCLTHALRARLPIVAFDLGAIAERLHSLQTIAELLPLNAEPEKINNGILTLALRRHEASRPSRTAPSAPTAPLPAAKTAADTGLSTVFQPFELTEYRDIGADAPTMPEPSIGLTASVQLLTLNKGLYSFSVQQAAPSRINDDHDLILPAVQVAVAPGIDSGQVEFMTGLRREGAWLIDSADILIAKIKVAGTQVLVTSYSARGSAPLSIHVERIDVRRPATAGAALPTTTPLAALSSSSPIAGLDAPGSAAVAALRDRSDDLVTGGEARFAEDGRRIVRTQITAHISMRGDVSFVDETWAGVMGERLPIEAFSIRPLELLSADDIEYKALTEKGVETPWISSGQFCGTRQMNLWLSGFAVRLKGKAAKAFDCSYRGSFRSGAIIGPLTNGAPLRSAALDDVLQAIQVTITETGPSQVEAPRTPLPPPAATEPEAAIAARPIGPRFSVFREEIV